MGLFENSVVYSCMRSTSVNMFSADRGRLPHFDKNFIYWGGATVLLLQAIDV